MDRRTHVYTFVLSGFDRGHTVCQFCYPLHTVHGRACASGRLWLRFARAVRHLVLHDAAHPWTALAVPGAGTSPFLEIGRASCRERVCQSVLISVVAEPLKKKKNIRE